jgi:hypothetical protein
VSLMALRRNDVALRDAPTKPLQEVSVSHTAQRWSNTTTRDVLIMPRRVDFVGRMEQRWMQNCVNLSPSNPPLIFHHPIHHLSHPTLNIVDN